MTDQTHAIEAQRMREECAKHIEDTYSSTLHDWKRDLAAQIAAAVRAVSLAAPGQSATDAAREIVETIMLRHDADMQMTSESGDAFLDEMVQAIAAFAAAQVAAARLEEKEAAADIIENFIVVTGENGPYLRPAHSDKNHVGPERAAYGAAIRARKSP